MRIPHTSAVITAALLSVTGAGCHRSAVTKAGVIEPVYNARTGRLELLKYDSNRDGTFDTFSHMDGSRVVRIDIDANQDGRIDRREYYRPDQTIEKIAVSTALDGVEDAWSFADAGGVVIRTEIATRRDGVVNRIEHFRNGVRINAEEDTDGDGRPDKWETYAGPRIASVSFDLRHRGAPDRRLVYGADGGVSFVALP